MDARDEIVAERRDLAAFLGELSAAEWRTPSLCAGWAVRDVVAHLVTPYVVSPWSTAGEMVRRRSIAGAMAAMAARIGARSDGELLQAFVDHLDDVFVPPGAGIGAPLTDIVVHGADIRWNLDALHPTPGHRVIRSLDFVTSWRASPVFLPRRRLRGLSFATTDVEWSSGSGDEVRGAAIDVLLAILGRRPALERVDGRGVGVLAARIG